MSPAKSTRGGWKKIFAFAVVAIMVAAGFIALAPALTADHAKAVQAPSDQASAAALGPREVSYTMDHMFESYQKVSGPQSSHSGPAAINTWWYNRCATYGDVVVRDRFPYVVGYGPYSAEVPAAGVAISTMKYGLYGFYRTTIDARNLTTIGTGPGMQATFFPILYPSWTTGLNMDGGYMNLSYYMTYSTLEDEAAATSGTSYQKTYYGVPGSAFNFGGANADDGWYIEFQGRADFNRAAAKKFLGLTGSASLITQFNANNTGVNAGKMNTTLADWWTSDGSNTGNNDTYASYDYSLDYSPLSNGGIFMMVDPASTTSHLVLRMYAIVWGIEYLMNRYLDRIGVMSSLVTSPEDWYLNVSLTPEGGNVFSRYVSCYNILAWKDPGYFSASWMIDTVHMDYTPNTASHSGTPPKWTSRYNQYYAGKIYKPTYMEWTPGTLAYGTAVAYWYPPMCWNLTQGERLQVKLPSASESVLGYMPYKGTGTSDKLITSKLEELQAHTVWGEIGLGTISPASLRNNYDPATKTLTIVGPTSFNRNPNTLYHNVNATGTPNFQFDVMRVSNYNMAMVEAPPYNPGPTYHLQITATNVTGATVTDWNGTAVMSAPPEVTLGATLVTFVNGVATITISSSSSGNKVITATDSHNDLDVVNTITVPFGAGNSPPSVTQPANMQAWAGASTSFTATATDADGDTLRYTWNFGDGTALQVGNPTTHAYTVGKTYTFAVYVDDLTGVPGHNVSKSATAQIAFNKALAAGWNLVSVPLTGFGYKASTLGLATGDMVVEWNSTTQSYSKTYIKGISGSAQDFIIAPSTGYWIWVASAKTLHWYGVMPTEVQTRTVVLPASGAGWFTLGFASYSTTWKAANVPGMFTPTSKVTMVAYYDTGTKSYKTWISAVPTLNNFALTAGQGYWCYANGATGLVLNYTP